MKKSSLLLGSLLFAVSIVAQNRHFLYVDKFDEILDDPTKQAELLEYAQEAGFDCLMFYGLHRVHNNHNLTNPTTNQILADFIKEAKTNYGILEATAIGESASFFETRIDAYNNTRSDPLEKFDSYNLEFEFWNTPLVTNGGYYCTTYLEQNNLACDTSGAIEFYLEQLEGIKLLAEANTHDILTETYVGWPNQGQCHQIAAVADRILVHAYRTDPITAYAYTENRLEYFGTSTNPVDLSIIYSSEPNFMGPWLTANSLQAAEDIYMADYNATSESWKNNINLLGFSYFTYIYMPPIQNCDIPQQITSEVFSGNVAKINWLFEEGVEKYKIRYRPIATTTWTEVFSRGAYRFLNGLSPMTNYEYQLKTVCAGDNSIWSGSYQLTTLSDACDLAPTSTVTFVDVNSMLVNWESNPDDVKYKIKYRPIGGTWIIETINSTSKTLVGLSPATIYQYKIKTKCLSGWINWTAVATFETPDLPTNRLSDESQIIIFPNPSSGSIAVQNSPTVKAVNIYSLNGKLHQTVEQNFTVIDIRNLSEGIYIIKLVLEDGSSVHQKLLKH